MFCIMVIEQHGNRLGFLNRGDYVELLTFNGEDISGQRWIRRNRSSGEFIQFKRLKYFFSNTVLKQESEVI